MSAREGAVDGKNTDIGHHGRPHGGVVGTIMCPAGLGPFEGGVQVPAPDERVDSVGGVEMKGANGVVHVPCPEMTFTSVDRVEHRNPSMPGIFRSVKTISGRCPRGRRSLLAPSAAVSTASP